MSATGFLLKIRADRHSEYRTVAALRASRYEVSFGRSLIDAIGVLLNLSETTELRNAALRGQPLDCLISWENGDRQSTSFILTRFDLQGYIYGEPQYRVVLESASMGRVLHIPTPLDAATVASTMGAASQHVPLQIAPVR